MNVKNFRYKVLFFVCMFSVLGTYAQKHYFFEIGPLGGLSYYMGDAHTTILQHNGPAYGGVFRYKFNPRWVIAAKAQYSGFGFETSEMAATNVTTSAKREIIETDVTAEFNFFHLERNTYHRHAKVYSPYLFLGIGAGVYDKGNTKRSGVAPYLPVGFGFKWNMTERLNLNIAWQHQLYLKDNLEGVSSLDNTKGLNGSNFLNNDLTSSIALSLTINFGREKRICRSCSQ